MQKAPRFLVHPSMGCTGSVGSVDPPPPRTEEQSHPPAPPGPAGLWVPSREGSAQPFLLTGEAERRRDRDGEFTDRAGLSRRDCRRSRVVLSWSFGVASR